MTDRETQALKRFYYGLSPMSRGRAVNELSGTAATEAAFDAEWAADILRSGYVPGFTARAAAGVLDVFGIPHR